MSSGDPESFVIDVGYRDPLDPRDVVHEDRDDRPGRDEYDDAPAQPAPAAQPMRELSREQLERELAFGNGIRQVLARDELARRAGDGYQPTLFRAIL